MTDKTQPEALQLADELDEWCTSYGSTYFTEDVAKKVSTELRRQHARIAELEAQIEAVGAGGVQQLRVPPSRTALPDGWTACTIEFGNDGPEEVAYGPQVMMTRLAKWLGKYFERVIAEASTTPANQAQAAINSGAQAAPDNEWKIRGRLASALTCWHRLTGAEADELVALFGAIAGPQPEAAPQAAPTVDADMFWDGEDGEIFGYEIDEIIGNYGPGDRVKIDCAKRLPSIEVLVVAEGDDFSYQIIGAALAAQGGA